jgi:hypothetical protein
MSKSLTELIRDANREITPADRHAILDLIEQQAARIAELESADSTDYEAIEREHLGDSEKKTGIYADRAQSSQQGAVAWIQHRNGLVFLDTLGDCERLEDLPHGTKLYTHPHATESDRRDAERYRWLKMNAEVILNEAQGFIPPDGHQMIYTSIPSKEEMDAAIDAALSQMQEPGGEG